MGHYSDKDIKNIKPGPIAWMACHPVAVNLIMIILLLGGFMILSQSKKEIFPEFQLDLATITMSYPGASPAEIEQGIILSIEDAVKDIDGIDEITSAAYEGYGHVIVEIEDEDESIRIAQDIKTAVDQITTFPVDAENLTVSLAKNEEIVMSLALYGSVSDTVLRNTAELVRERMEQHKDVSLVAFNGVRNHEVHIEVSQANLRRYNLSIPEISNIISGTSIELGGGSIKTSAGEILVRMTERRDYAADFKDIPIIKNPNGSTVFLGDIAKITDTFEDTNKYAHFNGKPAIEIIINSSSKKSPTEIAVAVKKIVHELNDDLPGDLQLAITRDLSLMFQGRAELLVKNGIVGLILVVIFLALFLDVRLAFWVSMGIPISYMGAFVILMGHDFSINMVSMFAFIIALGIVVDDAVVVGENIYHKRELGLKPLEAAVQGAREMALPVSVSVLTNIVAFLPMFFMPGFMGKIFAIIPLIVISTFILSLFESLFILPAHLTFKQSKNIKNKSLLKIVKTQKTFNAAFDHFVQVHYSAFLKRAISLRYISLSVFLFVLIAMGSYVASGRLGIQMFPRVESDFSYAQAVLQVGAPEEQVTAIEQRMINAAKDIIAQNGQEQLSYGIFSEIKENVIELRTFLTDAEIRPISTAKFTELWRDKVGKLAGLESLTFASDRDGPGSGAALSVELSHNDIETLENAAIDLAKALEQFPSAQDIDDGAQTGKKQLDFTVTDLGYTLGLSPTEIGRQVRAAYYGSEALKQQRGRNEVRVLTMLPEDERNSSYNFKNMMLKAPNGSFVMLLDTVEVKEGRAYTTINRRNSKRVITTTSDVDPPSKTNLIIQELTADILPKLQSRYPGLTFSFEGQQADMRESMQSLFMGMFGILFVMYAILAIMFSSYTQPFMIMIAIPFSIVGAIIGHFIMGFSLSMVSMFGIIALAGVVINDSLILIDLANKKRKEGIVLFDAVITAATQRFRPITLTTLTTFVGLAPMMFETSRQARFLVPMAISLGYGIVFATLLTLILIPALYMINEDLRLLARHTFRLIFPKPSDDTEMQEDQ